MRKNLLLLILYMSALYAAAQANRVEVLKDATGMKLKVDGKDFMINGVNWDYVPIGSGILDPGIWDKSDAIIKQALDAEMALLRNMGVNAIRTYGLEPKWIQYIYENFGIYTMLNIQFGAYGLTIKGTWT
ncbi:MAG: glycosidase, partial [Ekhidna sp.]|nr:glycosidase [Ekhidna sp.]